MGLMATGSGEQAATLTERQMATIKAYIDARTVVGDDMTVSWQPNLGKSSRTPLQTTQPPPLLDKRCRKSQSHTRCGPGFTCLLQQSLTLH